MKENEVVYIIINGIQPYLNEINSFLAPQEGVSARVRYKSNWLPEVKDFSVLNKKEGCLVLRNFFHPEVLIPLRSIKINKVTTIGEVVYIEFSLGEHITYPDEQSLMNIQLKRATKTLSALYDEDKYENKENENLKNLIFLGTDIRIFFETTSVSNQVSLWGVLVEYLSELKKNDSEYLFEDFDFIKMLSLRDDNGNIISISYENIFNKDVGVYKLNSDSKIYFDILQRTFTRKHADSAVETPRRLELAFYDKCLYPARSNVYIAGKYDLFTLSLITSKTTRQIITEAFIEIDRENDKASFPINIPLKIIPDKRQVLLSIFSVFIFVLSFFCYLFSESIACYFPLILDKEGIKNFLLPILIMSGSTVIPIIRDFVLGRASLS